MHFIELTLKKHGRSLMMNVPHISAIYQSADEQGEGTYIRMGETEYLVNETYDEVWEEILETFPGS